MRRESPTVRRSGLSRAVQGMGVAWHGVRAGRGGFSLTELLVVIAIIGVLAAIGIPALRGLGESNTIDSATRQLLDDLGFARLRAINDRTTVYMLFVPPNVEDQNTNLAPYRLTGYTLFARRTVGEQPGRQSPRQLIPWRALPDKTFFPLEKLAAPLAVPSTNIYDQPLAWTNNFPLTITNRLYPSMGMYYLAFNPQGQLVRFDPRGRPLTGRDEYLSVAKGTVDHRRDPAGHYLAIEPLDITETPLRNRRYFRVNWLTGRAEVLGDLVKLDDGTTVIQGQPR